MSIWRRITTHCYMVLLVAAGVVIVVRAVVAGTQQTDLTWILFAFLGGLTSLFPVYLPRSSKGGRGVVLTVSTVFTFAAILSHGPEIAVLVTLVEVILSVWRSRKSMTSAQKIFFNVFNLPVTTFVVGKAFYLAISPFTPGDLGNPLLVAAMGLCGIFYFLVNATTIAMVMSLTAGQTLRAAWKETFLPVSVINFAEGSAAVVIFLNLNDAVLVTLTIALPTCIVIYYAYKTNLDRINQAHRHLEEMSLLHQATIEALAMAVDAKDQVTHGHIYRVQCLAVELAKLCGIREERLIRGLTAAALLHDVGKLAIPDHILNKPAALTRSEMETMKTHAAVGAEILSAVPFPYPVTPLVRHHHERWDGKGYPDGLAGTDIPIGARILAVVDCYDALRSDRPYRSGLSQEEVVRHLQSESGRAFDPFILERMIGNVDRLEGAAADAIKHLKGNSALNEQRHTPQERLTPGTVFQDIASVHKEVRAMHEISQSIGKLHNISETLTILTSQIEPLVPSDGCVVYLTDSESRSLVPYNSTGVFCDGTGLGPIAIPEGVCGWVAANRQTLFNVSPEPDLKGHPELARQLTKCLAVPLILNKFTVGVIALYSRQEFQPDHLRIVETLAPHAATAVRNALLYEATKQDAYTDPLTGLPNLRFFRSSVGQEIKRARELSLPLTLLVMDLDRFKIVNDQFGHDAGDRVLMQAADLLRNELRHEDTCIRYGGDEFLGLLRGMNNQDAEELVRRVDQSFQKHPFELPDGQFVSVGISIGKAIYPIDGEEPEDLLRVADRRMYEDKKARTARLEAQGNPDIPSPGEMVQVNLVSTLQKFVKKAG